MHTTATRLGLTGCACAGFVLVAVARAPASVISHAKAYIDWNSAVFREDGVVHKMPPVERSFVHGLASWNDVWHTSNTGGLVYPPTMNGSEWGSIGGSAGTGTVSDYAMTAETVVNGPSGVEFDGWSEASVFRTVRWSSHFWNPTPTLSFAFDATLLLELETDALGDEAGGLARVEMEAQDLRSGMITPIGWVGLGEMVVRNGEDFQDSWQTKIVFWYTPPRPGEYLFYLNLDSESSAVSVPAPGSTALALVALGLLAFRRRGLDSCVFCG